MHTIDLEQYSLYILLEGYNMFIKYLDLYNDPPDWIKEEADRVFEEISRRTSK